MSTNATNLFIRTPLEDAVIGSMYVLTGVVVTAANLPCLYVMMTDKQLNKNSCIKAGTR
jgi:hypothetical protein